MDLDAKIGQLLMAGFRGLVAAPGDPVLRDLEQHRLGSVVLFDYDVPLQSPVRNIESADQVRALIGVLQEAAGGGLLVAVDQEGGQVRRLREQVGFPELPSAQALGTGDPEETRRTGAETAGGLLNLGFNSIWRRSSISTSTPTARSSAASGAASLPIRPRSCATRGLLSRATAPVVCPARSSTFPGTVRQPTTRTWTSSM